LTSIPQTQGGRFVSVTAVHLQRSSRTDLGRLTFFGVTRICNSGFAEWRETSGLRQEIAKPTNKQLIQGAYQAFAEGDVPKVLGLMDDKIEWTEAEGFPLAGTYVGPQAVVDGVFMRLGEIGDEFTVTPTRFLTEDDTRGITCPAASGPA
jgi:hypothetical protein